MLILNLKLYSFDFFFSFRQLKIIGKNKEEILNVYQAAKEI